jgi:hypothetical protein
MSVSVRVSVEHDGRVVTTLPLLPGSVTDYRADGSLRWLHVAATTEQAVLSETVTEPGIQNDLFRVIPADELRALATIGSGQTHRESFTSRQGTPFTLVLTVTKETP